MMNTSDLKQLVENIIEYTKSWSITETEWYWSVECVRKPNNTNNKRITWDEFEVAIREEILYDLIFNKGCGLHNQMENDLCNYSEDDGESAYNSFITESKELEEKVHKIINDFVLKRGE